MPIGIGTAMAIGGGAQAITGLASSLLGKSANDDATKDLLRAQRRMEARLNAAVGDVQKASDDYIQRLDQISAEFDPFDMAKHYDSFYEQVIVPMERDYAEFVNPAVTAAYSGGVYSDDGLSSGAAKEAKAKTARSLSEGKSQALAGERENVISRNIALDARERGIAKDKLAAATIAPKMSAGFAGEIFKSETDTIAAQLAGRQAFNNQLLSLPGSILSGISSAGEAHQLLKGGK